MDNYMDSTSPEYVRRMASALNTKWEALASYVSPGVRVLDYGCGMPVEGGIRERVEAAGGVYECHDISTTVETAMRDAGATFRTKEDLQDRAGGYDVVFLSSVVHELTGQDDGFEEVEAVWGLVAGGGVAIGYRPRLDGSAVPAAFRAAAVAQGQVRGRDARSPRLGRRTRNEQGRPRREREDLQDRLGQPRDPRRPGQPLRDRIPLRMGTRQSPTRIRRVV